MGAQPVTAQAAPGTNGSPVDTGEREPTATPVGRDPAAPEHRSARLALYAGIALFVIGWPVLYLGYNGAATNPQVAAQMPYIVSGGFAGASLIVLGGLFVVVHVLLSVQANLRADIRALTDAMRDVGETVSRASVGAQGSTNGSVVALRDGASFHRPDCRLVSGREDLQHLLPAQADGRGLSACRVCKP